MGAPSRLTEAEVRDNRKSETTMYAPGDYLKVEFKDQQSGESEWMWVIVDRDDPERRVVFGSLDSESLVMTDLRLGQELAVSYDNIRDHRTPASFKPT